MTNRLSDTFAAARSAGRKMLCPFLTAGYPSLEATVALLRAAQRANDQGPGKLGCVELGIPFSDPVADGPTIQASYTHALSHGVTVRGTLEAVAKARAAGVTLPLMAMVSFSIVFKKGAREFAAACRKAGIDGVVLPDVPLEEAPAVAGAMREEGLRTTLLVAPTTPAERRAQIAQWSDGFVYYMSLSGITGERKELPPDIAVNVAALRGLTQAPICVGFGISTAAHVRQVVQIADGAIVGSAIVRRVAAEMKADVETLAGHVGTFMQELASGTV